jgi:hypothetical protein
MWDGFEGHPMRKDYVEPDDYEYEPTPHDRVLETGAGASGGDSGGRGQRAHRTVNQPVAKSIRGLSPAHVPRWAGDAAEVDGFAGSLLEVSMGPHHPSTHGVFRMMVTLDGETVVKLKPVFGYLHRNHEKLGENTTYLASMPYTDRLDYLFDDEQLGLRARRREAGGPAGPGARRVRARHPRRTHPAAQPHLPRGLPAAGHRLQRHAAHVRVSRAREDPRPVRVAQRLAHDVQLPAVRRLPVSMPPRNGSPPRPAGDGTAASSTSSRTCSPATRS